MSLKSHERMSLKRSYVRGNAKRFCSSRSPDPSRGDTYDLFKLTIVESSPYRREEV